MRRLNLILDWDGTVADTIPIWINVFSELLQNKGIKPTHSEIYNEIYGVEKGSIKFGIKDYKGFNEEAFIKVKNLFVKAPLFPDSLETIKYFSLSGIKVVIASNTPRELLLKALKYHKLEDYIIGFIGREDVSALKPDPECMKKAISLLRSDRLDIISIGDSRSDLQASKSAKIRFILFRPRHMFIKTMNEIDIKPHALFTEWKELPILINNARMGNKTR